MGGRNTGGLKSERTTHLRRRHAGTDQGGGRRHEGWNYNEARRRGEDEICEFGTEHDGEWYPIGIVDGQTYTSEPDDDIKIGRYIALTNPSTVLAMAARIEELEREAEVESATVAAALRLVAEVRHACGDDGKRMQDELVQYVSETAKDVARYRWLRQCANIKVWEELQTIMPWATDRFDAAIDAAME